MNLGEFLTLVAVAINENTALCEIKFNLTFKNTNIHYIVYCDFIPRFSGSMQNNLGDWW